MQLQQALTGGYANTSFSKPKTKKNARIKVLMAFFLGLLIGAVITFGGLRYYNIQTNPNAEEVIAKVKEFDLQKEIVTVDNVLLVQNIERIRSENEIQAEVYKDVEDGDYAIVYDSINLVIYRNSSNQIVYEGFTPSAILAQRKTDLEQKIKSLAISTQLVPDTVSNPQLSVITDVAKLRASNASFYAQSEQGDVMAFFEDASVIVLYRPSTGLIYSSGVLNSQIQ